MADATKNCESFSFRSLFAGAKTPLQRCRWLKKHTLNRCFLSYKRHTAAALSTHSYSSRGAVVSVVSAFRVHFLTFIDNYPVSQRASTARTSFPSFPCVWIRFAAVVSVVSSSFTVSGCKVTTFLPTNQIILKKSFIKNCKRTNKTFFVRFVVGVKRFW